MRRRRGKALHKRIRSNAARSDTCLRPAQTVLVDHYVKILHLARDGPGDLDGKRFRGLWQQGMVHIALGDPPHFPLVVVATHAHMPTISLLPPLLDHLA